MPARQSVIIPTRFRRAPASHSAARIIVQRQGRSSFWAAIPGACCRPCSLPHRSKAAFMRRHRWAGALLPRRSRVSCGSTKDRKHRELHSYDRQRASKRRSACDGRRLAALNEPWRDAGAIHLPPFAQPKIDDCRHCHYQRGADHHVSRAGHTLSPGSMMKRLHL